MRHNEEMVGSPASTHRDRRCWLSRFGGELAVVQPATVCNVVSTGSHGLSFAGDIQFAVGALLLVATVACGAGDAAPPPPPAADFTKQRTPPAPPGSDDFAERTFTEPLSLQDAEAVLIRTSVFGFGGMPPKRQVQAFNVVFAQPDAAARFRSLGTTASAAGRLYSLAGLLLLDPGAAMLLREALSENVNTILVRDSDVVYERPVREVADMVEQQALGMGFRRAQAETDAYFAALSRRERTAR
jgi:hypothetical protein